MKIHIPNSAFIGNIDSFLRNIDRKNSKRLDISTNKSWISVHPVVLCMIAAVGLPLDPANISCDSLTAKSAHYLERMKLFTFLGINSGIKIKKHESAGRFVPLTKITNSEELMTFITEIIPLLHLKPQHADAIKYVVSELVRNVLEHARSDVGAILCAQYHQKSNMIRIGIVDTGIGIKKSINQSHRATSHLEAMRLALIPGITGTTRREGGTEYNAGAGLFFIKSIATINRNFFLVYSGNAVYKLLKSKRKKVKLEADPFSDSHSKGEDFPLWQGTAVGIDISLDDTEEFSMLLDLIRDVYAKTVRERRRAHYKKPKFV